MLNNIEDYESMWLCHAIHTERRPQRLIGTGWTKDIKQKIRNVQSEDAMRTFLTGYTRE